MFAAWSEAGAGTEVKVVVVDRLENSKHTDHDGEAERATQPSNEMTSASAISQDEETQPLEMEQEPLFALPEERTGENVEAADKCKETKGEGLPNPKESFGEKKSQITKPETEKTEKQQREEIQKEVESFQRLCHCLWARLFGVCVLCMLFRRCLGMWCWLFPFLVAVCVIVLLCRRKRKNSQ